MADYASDIQVINPEIENMDLAVKVYNDINNTIRFINTNKSILVKMPIGEKFVNIPEFVSKTEMKRMEKKAKNKFKKQHYTYRIRGKRKLKSLYSEEKNAKTKTYIEQIEEQRNNVKSQILKHM